MRTKLISLSLTLLIGMFVWAQEPIAVSIYDDCSKNGKIEDIRSSAEENGHTWVNLGLPSGVKWATCNINAENPEDYGNYYAWGETEPKENYSVGNYKHANGTSNKLTKYCNNADYGNDGFTDDKTTLDIEDDAAHVNWGGAWRMPTYTEIDELIDNCTWTWTTQNDVNGYKVTSKTNGNSIFLPAAGFRYARLDNAGSHGYYWSSSLYGDDPHRVWRIFFNSSGASRRDNSRFNGFSVRPVCQSISMSSLSKNQYITITLYTNGCESSNTILCDAGQQVNINAVPENEHRHFVCWSDGNTDNPRMAKVTQDMILTTEFADDPILTLVPSNDSWGQVIGAGQFKPNSSCDISATANYGYHFAKWNDGNADNPRTVQITKDITYTAYFAPNQYTISAEVSDAERGSVSGGMTTDYLNNVTLTATADYGYHFVRWTDWNTDNPRTVQVTGDATYTAVFEKNTYTITAQSANNIQGYVYAPYQAEYLDPVSLTAYPNVGYHFTQWNDGNTDNPRTIVLTCDTTFTAEFAQTFSGQCGYDLYWQYAGHTLTISGTGAMYDYNGNDMPWLLFRDTTDAVVLEPGITHIGNNAFNGFVKVGKIDLPSTLTSIGANAFAGCRKLYDIYAYPTEPPVADNTSFANYNVNLYVPCDNLRDYQMDAVFGTFKYIECMTATDTEQVQAETSTDHAAQKLFRNGQVNILRGGKTYTTTGVEVK